MLTRHAQQSLCYRNSQDASNRERLGGNYSNAEIVDFIREAVVSDQFDPKVSLGIRVIVNDSPICKVPIGDKRGPLAVLTVLGPSQECTRNAGIRDHEFQEVHLYDAFAR